MFSVKKCQLFEGINPSFGILAEDLKGAQNAHGANKNDFLRDHHILCIAPAEHGGRVNPPVSYQDS